MPSPVISACIVCEDVRLEKRNLLSLMGCYGPPPDVTVFLASFHAPAKLCFAFYGKPISGSFTFRAEIKGPDGKLPATSIPPALPIVVEEKKGFFFLFFAFPAISFPKADKYTIALFSDGVQCYASTFRVVEATPEQRSSIFA